MYSLNQVKTLALCGRDPARSLPLWRGFLLIPLILVCFALAPQTQAVTPSPDGCYGDNTTFNTAEGCDALFMNSSSGTGYTAVGTDALVFNGFLVDDDGSFNGAFGAFALENNRDGFSNNAVGDSALFANVLGALNTAVGDQALENNDSSGAGIANFNTGIGG